MAEKEWNILDTYFKFPIRIHNELEMRKIEEDEERKEEAGIEFTPTDAPWVIGYVRLPYKYAKELGWSDSFSRHRSIKDVEKDGFDCTYVFSPDGEVYVCVYKREKFEKYFLAYMENMEKYIRKQATEVASVKLLEDEPQD